MPHPSKNSPTATLETLYRRARLLTEIRGYFVSSGYWEVETPLLSRDCCIDAWIEPYQVSLSGQEVGWLQTSPEFAMKRLLLAGADRIFQICKAFRKEEAGPVHNCEFTMLEWYAIGLNHLDQMQWIEGLIAELHALVQRLGWTLPAPCLPLPIHRLTYEEAFQTFAHVSPAHASREELLYVAGRGTPVHSLDDADRDDLLNLILVEQVEPRLKELGAVFLYDYPASQSALAVIRPGEIPVAERFELYLDGLEICNGYHELTDGDELRRRMVQLNEKRLKSSLPPLPVESRLQREMQSGFPASAGVALGWDRLVMWLLGLPHIAHVIPFPTDRA